MTYLNDADVSVVKDFEFNSVMYWRLLQIGEKPMNLAKLHKQYFKYPRQKQLVRESLVLSRQRPKVKDVM